MVAEVSMLVDSCEEVVCSVDDSEVVTYTVLVSAVVVISNEEVLDVGCFEVAASVDVLSREEGSVVVVAVVSVSAVDSRLDVVKAVVPVLVTSASVVVLVGTVESVSSSTVVDCGEAVSVIEDDSNNVVDSVEGKLVVSVDISRVVVSAYVLVGSVLVLVSEDGILVDPVVVLSTVVLSDCVDGTRNVE